MSEDSDGSRLAEVILDQNPYGAMQNLGAKHAEPYGAEDARPLTTSRGFQPTDTSSALETNSGFTVDLDGLARGQYDADGHRLTFQDTELLKTVPRDGLWWSFRGKSCYVSKAMRIPYTYTIDGPDGKPITRNEYVLIGFEGAGW